MKYVIRLDSREDLDWLYAAARNHPGGMGHVCDAVAGAEVEPERGEVRLGNLSAGSGFFLLNRAMIVRQCGPLTSCEDTGTGERTDLGADTMVRLTA